MPRLLGLVLEIPLLIFGAWTLCFHLSILGNFPLWTAAIATLLLSLIAIGITATFGEKTTRIEWSPYRWLGIAAVVAALFTLFVNRPDADDQAIFQPALAQFQDLTKTYSLEDTLHNYPGLPPGSVLHALSSYEPFAVLLAYVLHLEPLVVYHVLFCFLSAAALPLVYCRLSLKLGLTGRAASVGAALSVLFLILCGGNNFSYGNCALVRLWQGKAILWTVLIPYLVSLALEFHDRPTRERAFIGFFAGTAAVGLNNSALFLVPVLGVCAAAASLSQRRRPSKWFFVAYLFTVFYPAAFAVAQVTGLFATPASLTSWTVGWETRWWKLLGFVVGGAPGLLFAVGVLVGALQLTTPSWRRWFSVYAVGLVIIFANPWSAKWWIRHILVGAYWRFAFLLPVAWAVGPGIIALARLLSPKRAWVTGLLLLALFEFSVGGKTVLSTDNGVWGKWPLEYRLPPKERAFALAAAPLLENKQVLVDEPVGVALSILNPTIRFEMAMFGTTVHKFTLIGRQTLGEERALSQRVVALGDSSELAKKMFHKSVDRGVNAIVTSTNLEPFVRSLLDEHWHEALQKEGYALLLRKSEN